MDLQEGTHTSLINYTETEHVSIMSRLVQKLDSSLCNEMKVKTLEQVTPGAV